MYQTGVEGGGQLECRAARQDGLDRLKKGLNKKRNVSSTEAENCTWDGIIEHMDRLGSGWIEKEKKPGFLLDNK